MEVQIVISGLGLSIKPLNLGVNAISGAYLNFRYSSSSNVVYTIAITNTLSIGGKSGSLIYGQVQTEFFPVLPERHPWAKNIDTLKEIVGQNVELSVGGMLLGDGNVTVKLVSIDDNYNTNTLISKANVPAIGGQAATTMVKGIAKHFPRPSVKENATNAAATQ